MATKTTKKEFEVVANIKTKCTMTITAENFNEALEKAQGLGITDFISFNGELWDSSVSLHGIYVAD